MEHREARVAAGLSLRAAAAASGCPKSQLWRFERGEIDRVSLADLGAWFSVLGMDLSMKVYPVADPLRDAASQRLLERLRAELHPGLGWRTEVPLPLEGDLRAWDAEIRGSEPRPWRCRVEAETRITDAQALERKLSLKLRDDPGGHLILLVADTRTNRAAMPALRSGFRELFTAGAGDVLKALREGLEPPGNAILLM
jgi:transcriptional regulator with XRE-family HTH domain